MPIAKDFTSVYTHDFEITFLHCMPNGLLRYTELCNLMQVTAGYHAEMGGLSFTDMQKHNQAWVLSRMRVEISALPKWRDTVTVKTWIVGLQGARSVRALEMYCNGKKMAGAITYWAVFNTKERKSEHLALPHDHFEKFPQLLPTDAMYKKVDLARESGLVASRAVKFSDLDIVNHANNVKYLEWCLDEEQVKPLLKQRLKSFDMNFLRELKLGDEVAINRGFSGNISYFTIEKAGKASFALELEWH